MEHRLSRARDRALRQQGRQVDDGSLKHVAPVDWNHINLTGDYSWRQNKRVEKGEFRPLRLPLQPSELYFPFRQTSPYVRDGTLVGRSHVFPYQGAVFRGFDHEICYIGT